MVEAWLPANRDSSMNSQKTDLCTQLSEKYQNYPCILLSNKFDTSELDGQQLWNTKKT